MRRETRKLRAQYGRAFDDYALACRSSGRGSRFRRRSGSEALGSFYRRNGEYQSALGVAIALALLCLKLHAPT